MPISVSPAIAKLFEKVLNGQISKNLAESFVGQCPIWIPQQILNYRRALKIITVHRQDILLLAVESGTRKLRKVVESMTKFPLMLSVPWIPRQCLSWIPRHY